MPKLTITAKKVHRVQLLMGDLPKKPSVSAPIGGDITDLISTDPNNDLTIGSDGKLALKTDELTTSFNFSETVKAVWSI